MDQKVSNTGRSLTGNYSHRKHVTADIGDDRAGQRTRSPDSNTALEPRESQSKRTPRPPGARLSNQALSQQPSGTTTAE